MVVVSRVWALASALSARALAAANCSAVGAAGGLVGVVVGRAAASVVGSEALAEGAEAVVGAKGGQGDLGFGGVGVGERTEAAKPAREVTPARKPCRRTSYRMYGSERSFEDQYMYTT